MVGHIVLAKGNRGAGIVLMVLAILTFNHLPVQAQNTTVAGVIQNASGQPVAGALVKVHSADLGLGFMVVSQAQGRYNTPNLLPGKYTVQGFGGGYQSDPAGPVEVRSVRKDNRYRIQRNTHREMVRERGSYIFVNRAERSRRVPARRVSRMLGNGPWYKDRAYPHKFVRRRQVFKR